MPRQAYGVPAGLPGGASPYGPLVPAQQAAASARVIRADAPQGFAPQHLGMPLDAMFNPMMGGGAGTLFPQAGPPMITPIHTIKIEYDLIKSVEQLSATLHVTVYNGDVSVAQTKRFGFYRAMQLDSVYELRDNTPMTMPPAGAVYYPWRVYVGHSYSEIVEGEATTFSGNVGAEFLSWSGSLGAFRGKYNLRGHFTGRGLVPTSGDALFARTPDQITGRYRADGVPVPILVEYRQIPNTPPRIGEIAWTPATPPRTIEVRFNTLEVGAAGSLIRSVSNWNLRAQCFVNGQPVVAPTAVLQQQVSDGGRNFNLSFAPRIAAMENDAIECTTSGTYSRGQGSLPLGSGGTGAISVRSVGTTPMGGAFEGRDPNTQYKISWTAARVQ